LAEIASLAFAESAVEWARASIGAKNSLTAEDARTVEAAFRERMRVLEPDAYSDSTSGLEMTADAMAASDTVANPEAETGPTQSASAVDSGQERHVPAERVINADVSNGPVMARPRRYRDKEHLNFVTAQACVVCGREPSEAHHLRFAQPRALGRKVSDEFAVPLCRIHHREVHDHGDETAWWNGYNIKPMPIAFKLWQHTRGFVPVADGSNGSTDKEKNRATAWRVGRRLNSDLYWALFACIFGCGISMAAEGDILPRIDNMYAFPIIAMMINLARLRYRMSRPNRMRITVDPVRQNWSDVNSKKAPPRICPKARRSVRASRR
jgi:hypothetical protein